MSRTGVGRCHGCGCEENLTHFDDCSLFRDRPEGLKFIPRCDKGHTIEPHDCDCSCKNCLFAKSYLP